MELVLQHAWGTLQALSAAVSAPVPRPSQPCKRQLGGDGSAVRNSGGASAAAAAASPSVANGGWMQALATAMVMFIGEHTEDFASELDRFMASGLTMRAFDESCPLPGGRCDVGAHREEPPPCMAMPDEDHSWGGESGQRVSPSMDRAGCVPTNVERQIAEMLGMDDSDGSGDGYDDDQAAGHSFGLGDQGEA